MIDCPSPRPEKGALPPLRAVMRVFALPEIRTLRELRRALSFGGLTPAARRSPEDHARITTFRILEELLHFLDKYRRRIEAGETLRLVEVEHARAVGREDVIDSVELVDRPGTCAGCRRAFRDHSDPELRSCAASYESTQPSAEGS